MADKIATWQAACLAWPHHTPCSMKPHHACGATLCHAKFAYKLDPSSPISRGWLEFLGSVGLVFRQKQGLGVFLWGFRLALVRVRDIYLGNLSLSNLFSSLPSLFFFLLVEVTSDDPKNGKGFTRIHSCLSLCFKFI